MYVVAEAQYSQRDILGVSRSKQAFTQLPFTMKKCTAVFLAILSEQCFRQLTHENQSIQHHRMFTSPPKL